MSIGSSTSMNQMLMDGDIPLEDMHSSASPYLFTHERHSITVSNTLYNGDIGVALYREETTRPTTHTWWWVTRSCRCLRRLGESERRRSWCVSSSRYLLCECIIALDHNFRSWKSMSFASNLRFGRAIMCTGTGSSNPSKCSGWEIGRTLPTTWQLSRRRNACITTLMFTSLIART